MRYSKVISILIIACVLIAKQFLSSAIERQARGRAAYSGLCNCHTNATLLGLFPTFPSNLKAHSQLIFIDIYMLNMSTDKNYGYPGYEQFCFELSTLLTNHPPEFIYIHDIEAIRTTTNVTRTTLHDLSSQPSTSGSPAIHYAHADCVESFTARLLYESIINTLVRWEPRWEDGCANWRSDLDIRWNENMDSFIHGLRLAHAHLTRQSGGATDKGKGKAKEGNYPNVRLVIVIERPERLKESLPELLVPLTRLSELVRVNFCSDI